MRKEVQSRVKQDLKECMPAPAETSIMLKETIPNESKLGDSSNISSNTQINVVRFNDNAEFTIKQEVDDVNNWKDHQENTVNNNLDSNRSIKKEITDIGIAQCESCEIEASVSKEERPENHGSPYMSPKEPGNSKNLDNVNNISKGKAMLPQSDTKYPYKYHLDRNVNLNSSNETNVSDMLPVNLSVVKNINNEEDDYHANQLKVGKRKRSSYDISSITKAKSNTFVSVRMDEKAMNCNTDKMFCSMMSNPEFYGNSPYSQIRKPEEEKINWERTTYTNSSSSGTYIVSNVNESPISNSHLSYSYSDQNIHDEIENNFQTIQNRTSFMSYNKVTSNLKERDDEKSYEMFHISNSPMPVIYSGMSIHSSEITNKIRCSCDKCLSVIELAKGCDRYDDVPKYLHKKMTENLNSNGEELFRRIEESLAETETLKSQEEELLKRIAKSLNEAETLKFKEEELLKKIERSISEAETLKSREEEILRRIEVSLAKSETVRSQDDELLMKIEASLQNSQFGVAEDTEFESKYNVDLDFSLPLKKRKKRLKTLIQKEDVKPLVQQNLVTESFPSYPSRPMISIAELLQKNVPMFEQFSVASPIPYYSSKSLYSRNANVEHKSEGTLDCSSKNNTASKMFSICKSEESSASCSYRGVNNAFVASGTEDKICKNQIKRECESPVTTEQQGVINFNSGFYEALEVRCSEKYSKEMDLSIKKEESKELNVKNKVENTNKRKKLSFPNKGDALDNGNCPNLPHLDKVKSEDGITSEIKLETFPIDSKLIKKESCSD